MAEKVHRLPAAAPQTDPLLAALIAKLPPTGANWSIAKRTAWLQMFWMAMNTVYEGADGDIELPAFLPGKAAAEPAGAPTTEPGRNPLSVVGNEPARFYIAKDGRALRDPGKAPVHVNDVPHDEVIWDERPLGMRDLDTIVWADGAWPPGSLPSLNIASG